MIKPIRSRRVVALLAAYVVALQALLLPLSVASGATFDGGLCVTASADHGGPPPARHNTGCACAAGCGMQCCAQALTALPPVVIALDLTGAGALEPAPMLAPDARQAVKSPQLPRAPPAA